VIADRASLIFTLPVSSGTFWRPISASFCSRLKTHLFQCSFPWLLYHLWSDFVITRHTRQQLYLSRLGSWVKWMLVGTLCTGKFLVLIAGSQLKCLFRVGSWSARPDPHLHAAQMQMVLFKSSLCQPCIQQPAVG